MSWSYNRKDNVSERTQLDCVHECLPRAHHCSIAGASKHKPMHTTQRGSGKQAPKQKETHRALEHLLEVVNQVEVNLRIHELRVGPQLLPLLSFPLAIETLQCLIHPDIVRLHNGLLLRQYVHGTLQLSVLCFELRDLRREVGASTLQRRQLSLESLVALRQGLVLRQGNTKLFVDKVELSLHLLDVGLCVLNVTAVPGDSCNLLDVDTARPSLRLSKAPRSL